jgi:hypothetical protein
MKSSELTKRIEELSEKLKPVHPSIEEDLAFDCPPPTYTDS